MLLTLDVGNTNITIGLYDQEKLVQQWRAKTDWNKTADEYGLLFTGLLHQVHVDRRDITGLGVASVVPPVTRTLQWMGPRWFDREPVVVGAPGVDPGIRIRIDNPSEAGADRVVNAVGGFAKYGGPLVVVDFGTATTWDCVSQEGDYVGGAIAPGIGISMEALFSHAAKLYRIDLVRPPQAIGRNTVHALQSGIVIGYAGQVDELVRRCVEELGGQATVVATGGLAELIAAETRTIQKVDQTLTLDGIRIVWERNRK